MRILFVDGLHQKALAWDATGVSFDKVVPQIQRIIDGKMSLNEVVKFTTAWIMLRRYGNQACDNAAIDGTVVVDSVTGWKRTEEDGEVDWNYVLQTITWIQEVKKEIRDIETQEGGSFILLWTLKNAL